MKISYTGGNGEFTDSLKAKLEKRLIKLGRMIDKKGEKEGHVILTEEKRSKKAEVTVNYLHHAFVAAGSGPAYLPALTTALDKLEKQIVRKQAKLRDTKREGGKPTVIVANEVSRNPVQARGPQVFPAKVSKKPMNVDEAVMVALRKKVNFVAFRDAETEGISVVVMRADGNFDVVRA